MKGQRVLTVCLIPFFVLLVLVTVGCAGLRPFMDDVHKIFHPGIGSDTNAVVTATAK